MFFIIVIAFGNIVMLNLFLAILLGNFDRARDFGAKKKLLECFLELRDNGRDFSECIDMILTEQQDYIKFNILKWDRRIITLERSPGQSSSFVRQMLASYAVFMEKMDYPMTRKIKDPPPADQEGDEPVENASRSSAGRRKRRSSRLKQT